MTDEQIQAWETLRAWAIQTWEAIQRIIRDVVDRICRVWRSLPKQVRQYFQPPIARRKIRRYARLLL